MNLFKYTKRDTLRVHFFVFYTLPGSHSRIHNYARPALLNTQHDTLAARTYKFNQNKPKKQKKLEKNKKSKKIKKTKKIKKNKKTNITRLWPYPYVFKRVPEYCFFGFWFFWFSIEPRCSLCARIFLRRAVRGACCSGLLLNSTHKGEAATKLPLTCYSL